MAASLAQNNLPDNSPERYSGHESFACRYGWLTKIYRLILKNPQQFQDLDAIMVELGVGKNMAKSLRFWAGAYGLVDDTAVREVQLTAFADWLMDPEQGVDPYLEDTQSLWLLHWRLTSTANLAAWQLLFFDTPETESLRSRITERILQRAASAGRKISPNTVRQHTDIFINSYATRPARSTNALEHVLACPLQELELVNCRPQGRTDEIIEMLRTERAGISELTLARIVCDYWRLRAPSDRTLSLASLMLDVASPGLVLRIEERALNDRIEAMARQFPRVFRYVHGIERQSLMCVPDTLESMTKHLEYV